MLNSVAKRPWTSFSVVVAAAAVILDIFADHLPVGVVVALLALVFGRALEVAVSTNKETVAVRKLVAKQSEPVKQTRQDVAFIKKTNERIKSTSYDSEPEFFAALLEALKETETHVRVTQMRDHTPTQQGEMSAEWSRKLAKWSKKPGRSCQRVMSLPNDEMRAWAEEQHLQRGDGARISVRAVAGESGVPAVNFAIFDNTAVFIILTSSDQQAFAGIGISNETVAKYFADHFSLIFDAAEPIEVALGLEATVNG